MADFINTIDVLGDDAVIDSIIKRTIPEYKDDTITKVGPYAFCKCTALETVDLPNVNNIANFAFNGCTALTALILRNTAAVVTLSTSSALNGTPYIYIPAALLTQYAAANNWSSHANRLRKLEEWTVDGTVTGELIDDAANKHIVRFYNSDGTPLGYTHVATGGDAIYSGTTPVDPAGENPFAGFVPAPENVTADMDCYAKFANQWDEVFASIAAGTYATDYAIGDTIPLDLGTEGVVNMQIVAFDTDDLADGSGKAAITWVSKELLQSTYVKMNPALVITDDGLGVEGTGSIGGWEKSAMRTYLKETIKPLIPSHVRNSIKEVTKSQNAHNQSGVQYTQTTTDDVWLLGKSEICYDYGRVGRYTFFSTPESNIRNFTGGAYYPIRYWLRDVSHNYGMEYRNLFYVVSAESGTVRDNACTNTHEYNQVFPVIGFCT